MPTGLPRRRWHCLVLLALTPLAPARAQQPPASPRDLAAFEDFTRPAGHISDGVLRVTLETRRARWQPWGDSGPSIDAHAFAIAGEGPKVPGPLLRVRAGTQLEVTVRNSLTDTLIVRGLRDRVAVPGGPANANIAAYGGDSLIVAPGEAGVARFTATVAGDFTYFAETRRPGWSATPQPLFGVDPRDRGLAGVLIVDGADETIDARERIFLVTAWADSTIPASWQPTARYMINGRSWPHTERFTYAQGDTVRWRVLNRSGAFHPMHLHGFYFEVTSFTNPMGASAFAPGETSRSAVTFPLPPGTAMRLRWEAHEPGNWLFHCHLMQHMSWMQAPPRAGEAAPHHAPEAATGEDLLGGLILGITVTPRPDHRRAVDVARRALRLHIGKRDRVFGDQPAYGFVLQEGATPPARDSVRFPGSTILLTRGEPTQITVFNNSDVALGVHWHGLELESWSDGVPSWSGRPGRVIPAIKPGDSLTVRMTPPRAGTFMYHVHSEPGHQLATGLYGGFLVHEPGMPWDRDADRTFLLGSLGAGEQPPPVVNGERQPAPQEFEVGRTYRLRFMHISPDDSKRVQIFRGDSLDTWTMVARDGAELPAAERRVQPAVFRIMDTGNTFDVLWTPTEPGDRTLRIRTAKDGLQAGFIPTQAPAHVLEIALRVTTPRRSP